jgi:hypothetical protein
VRKTQGLSQVSDEVEELHIGYDLYLVNENQIVMCKSKIGNYGAIVERCFPMDSSRGN